VTEPTSGSTAAPDQVVLPLSRSEALVLFEFLSRYTQNDRFDIADQAEQRVLWDMCAHLETVLSEPFRSDYDAILAAAREAVRDEEG